MSQPLLENICKYVDSLLQPHVVRIKTFIKDPQDFIQKIENIKIPENAMLLSFDVISLYMSIPHEDITFDVKLYLDKDDNLQPLVHFLLDLVHFLLEKNYFCFDGEFYFQTKGVSMGSSFAPSVANLFMADLEEQFILTKDQNLFLESVFIFFYRYTDDCFCVYTHENTIQVLVSWFNELHSSINFTFIASVSHVNFLDTKV